MLTPSASVRHIISVASEEGRGTTGKRRRGRPRSASPLEERVSISLPTDLLERVHAMAVREERSIAAVIRLLIRDGLEVRERRR